MRERPAKEFGFDTRSIHAGQRPEPYTGARAVPIFQTTSYVFEDPDSAAAYFNLQEYGNTYSRIMNPTVAVFEERVASLERAAGGVAFASGLAAQAAAFFTMLTPGDHVVSSSALYGGTLTQLKHLARKLSLEVTFVDPDDLGAWRAALRPTTKLFIGGHGTSIGGVVVEAGTFDWSNGRFPVVADPSPAYHGLAFHETFGMYGYLMKLRAESLRD